MSVQVAAPPKDASSKKPLPFSKGAARRLSKKGKEGANGLDQRATDDAGVTSTDQGDSGAAATTPSTSETGECMRHRYPPFGHLAEQILLMQVPVHGRIQLNLIPSACNSPALRCARATAGIRTLLNRRP